MKRWVRDQWLRAQGVPDWAIRESAWKGPRWEVYPPHCVACDRAWRPDYPRYISVYGKTRYSEILTGYFVEWYSPTLKVAATTGLAPDQDQVRHLCTEHGDRWEAVSDCVTGQAVEMKMPPSRLQRLWRDVRYWTGTALRFAFLIGQWVYLWAAYKTVKYAPIAIRAPWPPLRESS